MMPAPLPYTDRFKLRAAVYVLPRREGRVLLALRQNTGFGDGLYGVVGGHLDGGEGARVALAREGLEEAGMIITPDLLIPRLTSHRSAVETFDEAIDFFFDLHEWDGEITNTEPHKCAGFLWAYPHDLPANTIPYIRHAITAIAAGKTYTEFGWS